MAHNRITLLSLVRVLVAAFIAVDGGHCPLCYLIIVLRTCVFMGYSLISPKRPRRVVPEQTVLFLFQLLPRASCSTANSAAVAAATYLRTISILPVQLSTSITTINIMVIGVVCNNSLNK